MRKRYVLLAKELKEMTESISRSHNEQNKLMNELNEIASRHAKEIEISKPDYKTEQERDKAISEFRYAISHDYIPMSKKIFKKTRSIFREIIESKKNLFRLCMDEARWLSPSRRIGVEASLKASFDADISGEQKRFKEGYEDLFTKFVKLMRQLEVIITPDFHKQYMESCSDLMKAFCDTLVKVSNLIGKDAADLKKRVRNSVVILSESAYNDKKYDEKTISYNKNRLFALIKKPADPLSYARTDKQGMEVADEKMLDYAFGQGSNLYRKRK